MRNFRSTNNRLAAIEGRHGMDIIKLTFADGSTRGIKIAHDYQLQLFMDACEWARAYPPPAPEGMVDVDPPLPEPKTPSDRLIALLGQAVEIDGEHVRFIQTIASICRQAVETKGRNDA
ncbi:MAG TPA: hypothetical protein VN087_02680 [Verrucomicrobiae bacterium]|nr:hypothetical protein [Verrucomicrobiae bacterium]